jgi:hypothetical protein
MPCEKMVKNNNNPIPESNNYHKINKININSYTKHAHRVRFTTGSEV